ncbi:MAG: hypothetical protein IIW40_00130 [Clostridia bacterium]|nr:hypothetical protein [Clostridia bacterium]
MARYEAYDDYDDLPEEQMTAAQKRQVRRKKAKRRMLRRLIVFVLTGAALVTVWKNWDTLAPDKLLSTVQDFLSGSAGSYPVDVSGAHVRRLVRAGTYTVMLSDSYLTYLDDTGGEVNRYPCNYSSPLLSHAGRYILLAEQQGRRVQLNTRSGIVTQVDAPLPILAAAVNKKGQFAVLTQGPQGYTVQVTVYDRHGDVLYTRSRNQQATEVALSADGKQVALLSVQAVDGSLHSTMEVFSVTSSQTEALCSHLSEDALLYRLEYLGNGWLAAIGEKGITMLDTADGLATVYDPVDKRPLGYAAAPEHIALAVRSYGHTGGGQVQIINKKGEPLCSVDFVGEFRQLSYSGEQYLLLTDTEAVEITTTGAKRRAAVESDGQQAIISGDKAVVLGLNMVQAYSLEREK